MPAELPFTPESDSLEDELFRWSADFRLRSEGSPHFDSLTQGDSVEIAKNLLEEDEDVEDNWDLVEHVSGRAKELSTLPEPDDRFSMLHVTRENMTEVVNEGQLPPGFLNDLHQIAAEYLNGFIPDQNIRPPSNTGFQDTQRDYAGSHNFREDRSMLYHAFGGIDSGSPAMEVAAHETMHKNNIEALLGSPQRTRNMAQIYQYEAPQEYTEIVEETVPEVKSDLLGGLSLFVVDELYDIGIHQAYIDDRRDDIDFSDHSDEFREAVATVNEIYDLENFDVRDETISQAVSYFIKGHFNEDFYDHAASTQESYNNLSQYQDEAGDKITQQLAGIRKEMNEAEGFRGQKFKQVMQNRIPFLKGEYRFKESL